MDSALPGGSIDSDVAVYWTIEAILKVMCMGQQGIAPTPEHQDAQGFIATDGLGGSNKAASFINGIAIGKAPPQQGGGDAVEPRKDKQIHSSKKKEATESIDTARLGDSFGQSIDKQIIAETQQLPPDDMFISDYIFSIKPMKQPEPFTCVIVATTVSTEVVSRHLFTTTEQPGMFCGNAEPPKELVKQCENDGTWSPTVGVFAARIGQLLRNTKRSGLPIENSDNRLWLKEWKMRWPKSNDGSASLDNAAVKQLLFDSQCFMGVLFITSDYCNLEAPLDGSGNSFQNYFPGCPLEKRGEVKKNDKKADYHAVVCYGYWDGKLEGEEGLRILVLDNHTEKGPSRWVDFRAFECLVTLTAELPSSVPPPSAKPAGSPKTTTNVVVSPACQNNTTVGPSPKKKVSNKQRTTDDKTRAKKKGLTPKKEK